MLASLTIKNVVLIDHLTIELGRGLFALTGETGAGKSILLDSLGLALGARSDSGLVRSGEAQAMVSAAFDLPDNHPVYDFLEEQGLSFDDRVMVRRSIGKDGKSRAFINDQPVSVSLLKQVGDMLVEIHGQFDTQSLLNPKTHRAILDEYAGAGKLSREVQGAWTGWADARKELQERRAAMERARGEEAYVRAALEQLDELAPKAGEEESLSALRSRLMKREQNIGLYDAAAKASEEAIAAVNVMWRALEKAGEGKSEIAGAADRASAELQEALSAIQSLSTELEESEHSLADIDDRLFALKAQARKHACGVDDLPQKLEELQSLVKGIENQDDALAGIEADVRKQKEKFHALAGDLSALRRKAGERLDRLVAKELAPLKLEKAKFHTSVEALHESEWGPAGVDQIQFLVATNPGAAAGPLNKIASGGEMARFMLALKVVMAEVGTAQTLVFDEVDSGIGGATADAVGERLARLSEQRQILVVTHSPQVAAKSAHHAVVMKTGKTNPTTKIVLLPDEKAREEEIARMLSGAEVTKEARAAAAKLMEKSAA